MLFCKWDNTWFTSKYEFKHYNKIKVWNNAHESIMKKGH